MLVTVSGPPGSGTSTTAAALADRFDLEYTSGGDIFRELATERGYSLAEFNDLAERSPEIDRDLDRRLHEVARDGEELVLESRLAGWLAGDHATLRIWLDAPVGVRAARIADREDKSVDQARTETTEREESEAQRYDEYYGIDIHDRSIYDVVLNTARWEPDVVEDILVEAIDGYTAEDDEGPVPVDVVEAIS